MAGHSKDYSGTKIGNIICLNKTNKKSGTNSLYNFKCECGNIFTKKFSNVKSYSSCGCKKKDQSRRSLLTKEKRYGYKRKHPPRSENPKIHLRSKALLRNFGITIEQYNQMFDNQNGCCAICKKHQSELNKTLCVDHDHITNKVRSLLCNRCNTAIGLFYEDITILENAKSYLICQHKAYIK